MKNIVVVGAGAAGLASAETLRREGFTGRLTLVGEEPTLPYDRPPLSKHVLAGTWDFTRTLLREKDHYAQLDVELRVGRRAIDLDLPGRTLLLDHDEPLAYDGLVIATGVTPRRLPFGHELDGVHVLRGEQDALRLRAALTGQPRVVVVGAGFLGMEVAAVVSGLGLDVTVVDPLPTPMVRQFGPAIGALIARLHSDHGVQVRTRTGVTDLLGSDGRVTGVQLDDGTVQPADCVLVAIGAAPEVGWLRSSGVQLGNGIQCDEYCQAAPGVYAAGDVASWPSPRYGRRLRLEHRMNATEQGTAAARNLLHGNVEAFDPVPYFWTDQYDVKIQAHGVFPDGARPQVVEGSPASGRFVALYREDGRTVGALGWNSARQVREYRNQLAEGPVSGGAK
ncbi:NAD(P)/FAD-dependent oxidoreductase [Streptomyces sp. NPDC002680]|uniref:NAD(P)/FAD-dependent oxidoreductase n=1 Tax=Streptomyces sp. NPDC002680 TaxID=3364659 RepID=UPI00369EDD88